MAVIRTSCRQHWDLQTVLGLPCGIATDIPDLHRSGALVLSGWLTSFCIKHTYADSLPRVQQLKEETARRKLCPTRPEPSPVY